MALQLRETNVKCMLSQSIIKWICWHLRPFRCWTTVGGTYMAFTSWFHWLRPSPMEILSAKMHIKKYSANYLGICFSFNGSIDYQFGSYFGAIYGFSSLWQLRPLRFYVIIRRCSKNYNSLKTFMDDSQVSYLVQNKVRSYLVYT